MRTWRFVEWLVAALAGAIYTVIQTGPDAAGQNLCKLAKKVVPTISDQCVPAFVQWGPAVIFSVGLIFGTLAISDLIGWSKKYRVKRPKKPRAHYQEREIGLLETLWWVAEKSAWGRYMAASQLNWSDELSRLRSASSFVVKAAMNGELVIRGRAKNSVEYHSIHPDLWRSAYIDLVEDNASIWKPVLKPYAGISVQIPEYDSLIAERERVETLWPHRNLKYQWHTLSRKIRGSLKRMKEKLPTEPATNSQPQAPEAASPSRIVGPEIPLPVSEPLVAPAPATIVVSTTDQAPEGWEKLFAIGDDGRSIWLKFLPDNKTYRRDTLVLIVFGHKVLRGVDAIRMGHAHAAVEKTIDIAPGRPFDESPLARALFRGVSSLTAAAGDRDYGADCVPEYLLRVGLAQGGMYQLTERGMSLARQLAYDLISRA